MRIHVINTGGTIGSAISGGVIKAQASAESELLTKYSVITANATETAIDYTVSEPFRILSENMDFEHIDMLIKEVDSVIKSAPDGIVITHGTDTLAYTAAFLYYVFANVDIPIILVSSNYVLTDKRANGYTNFKYAVKFIAEHNGTGVYVSYANANDYPTIHQGNMLNRVVELSDSVLSIYDSWYGRYVDEAYEANAGMITPSVTISDAYHTASLSNSKSVIMLAVYPGIVYPELIEDICAVVIGSYHSGTLPVNKELTAFAEAAAKLNIPIYVAGLNSREIEYETVEQYKKLGLIAMPDTPLIALYAQAKLKYSTL